MPSSKLYSERTNLQTIVVAISAFIVGIFLLLISEMWQQLKSFPPIYALVRDLGALLVSTVTIATLWELAGKKAFAAELMAKAKLAEEVKTAGINRVTTDFVRDIDWQQLFKTSNTLDIFICYGRTWRNTNRDELIKIAQRSNTKIRVILPDPDKHEVMKELSIRFATSSDDIKDKIVEASNDFKDIFKNSNFSLWYFSKCPVYSFYRFDHLIVLALFKHGTKRGKVPVFIVEEGGTIYKFVKEELNLLTQETDGLARQVFPSTSEQI